MSPIIPIALKDLKLLGRDPMGLFFIVVFPILMGLFFGVINKSFATGEPRSIKVGIVDHDQSDISHRFVRLLGTDKGITLRNINRTDAANLVRTRKLLAFIELPKGFGETAGILWADPPPIDIGIDPSRHAESALLQGRIMQAVGQLVQVRFRDPDSMRKALGRLSRETANDPGITPAARRAMVALFGSLDTFLGSMSDAIKRLNQQDSATATPGMQLADIRVNKVLAEPTERGKILARVQSPWDISFPSAMMWGIFGCVAGLPRRWSASAPREHCFGSASPRSPGGRCSPARGWRVLRRRRRWW